HGGAVLPGSHNTHEPSLEDRLVLERPEKTSIARAAASLVRPGTAIAIAAGSTTFALAQCLLDVPGLTIVTNSLRVANLYTGNRGPDGTSVLVTGGMRATSAALAGPGAALELPPPGPTAGRVARPADPVAALRHAVHRLHGDRRGSRPHHAEPGRGRNQP